MTPGKTFYFVVEARQASAIIATKSIMVSVFIICVIAVIYAVASEITSELDMALKKLEEMSRDTGNSGVSPPLTSTSKTTLPLIAENFFSLTFGTIVSLAFAISLLVGVITKRPKLILPWLIINGLVIVPFLFMPFVVFELPGATAKFFAFTAAVTLTGNFVYDWRIVYYCYKTINDVEHENLGNNLEI